MRGHQGSGSHDNKASCYPSRGGAHPRRSPAGTNVAGIAWTKNEVAAVGLGRLRHTKQLNMIDLGSIRSYNAIAGRAALIACAHLESSTTSASASESSGALARKSQLPPPDRVSCNEAISRYIQRDIFMQPVRRNVFGRHLSRLMQRRCHHARWHLDLVLTGLNPSHVPKRSHQTDRAMAAHAEITNVVEIDHRCCARRVKRLQQNRSHHNIRPARLIHNARPEKVIPFPKAFKPFRQRPAAKLRAFIDHRLGRFTCGMRINDQNGG
jgi:hypothetical protein